MNWELDIAAHWPHDRIAIGWEYIGPLEDEKITSYRVYLLIFTMTLHLHDKDSTS